MTLADCEQQIFAGVMASSLCGIPVLRRLSATSINLRMDLTAGGFIDVFYNEQTGTTAFALIQQNRRVFGADNTGGWHVHPFRDPSLHDALSQPMSFVDFMAEVESQFS
jgi:hypothetical protein